MLLLLAEHTLCIAPIPKQGPEPFLHCWGGLGHDGTKQHQPESSPRVSCRRAEPPLAARRTPGSGQSHPRSLGT